MSRAEQRREDTRARVLDAAIEVFADKGFFNARISEIAKVAGVAAGTIYLYFEKKDDLLISLFREKMGEILHRLGEIVSTVQDPEEQLRRSVAAHLDLVADQPKLMQVLTVELRASARFMRGHDHHAPFARYLAVIAGIVERGQKDGRFRPELKPATMARALFGAIDEMALSLVLGPEKTPFDRKAVAAELSEFFLRGLRVQR